MSVKLKIIILLCFLTFILPVVPMARPQAIAVFPVDDLSDEINSFNTLVTRYLAYRMVAKGLNVIQEQEIIDFMSSQRIRCLGYLDTQNILQTKEKLGADLILFGTIIIEKESSSYGLILNMVRTTDAKTIWTASGGLSFADTQHLLGLDEPTRVEELWPILIDNLLANWPADLNETLTKP